MRRPSIHASLILPWSQLREMAREVLEIAFEDRSIILPDRAKTNCERDGCSEVLYLGT
jgi:hypothetical protein